VYLKVPYNASCPPKCRFVTCNPFFIARINGSPLYTKVPSDNGRKPGSVTSGISLFGSAWFIISVVGSTSFFCEFFRIASFFCDFFRIALMINIIASLSNVGSNDFAALYSCDSRQFVPFAVFSIFLITTVADHTRHYLSVILSGETYSKIFAAVALYVSYVYHYK